MRQLHRAAGHRAELAEHRRLFDQRHADGQHVAVTELRLAVCACCIVNECCRAGLCSLRHVHVAGSLRALSVQRIDAKPVPP